MSSQKPDRYETGPSEREADLLLALDESLEQKEGGLPVDILQQLQQRRQAALRNQTLPHSTSAADLGRVHSTVSIWKRFGVAGPLGMPNWAIGMAAMCVLGIGILLIQTDNLSQQPDPILAYSDGADGASESVMAGDSSTPLDDWLLVASIPSHEWELIENAEFIAWLEEQEKGELDANRAG